MRVKKDLLVGEWAVLALLCEEPRHGYAIAVLLAPEGEIGRIWSLRRPMTYRTIAALEALELIEVESVVPRTDAPNRRVMRATPTARERVDAWLEAPEEHVRDLRSLLLLKILFLRRAGRPAGPLLHAQRAVLASQEGSLAERRESDDPDARMLARWRWSMTEAALRFVDLMIAEETATDARRSPSSP